MARFLAACRFLLVIPVVGCVFLTAGVVIMGVGRIYTGGVVLLSAGDFGPKAAKAISLSVIEIIDLFLVGICVVRDDRGSPKRFRLSIG